MRTRRRINPVVAAICAGLILIGIVLFANRESPADATNEFLTALAQGNVNKLMDLSYYQGDKNELRKEWEFATQVAGAHYTFTWSVLQTKTAENSANVSINITKNVVKSGSYEEQSAIPLVEHNGQWLVDVRAIDRSIYPDLPR